MHKNIWACLFLRVPFFGFTRNHLIFLWKREGPDHPCVQQKETFPRTSSPFCVVFFWVPLCFPLTRQTRHTYIYIYNIYIYIYVPFQGLPFLSSVYIYIYMYMHMFAGFRLPAQKQRSPSAGGPRHRPRLSRAELARRDREMAQPGPETWVSALGMARGVGARAPGWGRLWSQLQAAGCGALFSSNFVLGRVPFSPSSSQPTKTGCRSFFCHGHWAFEWWLPLYGSVWLPRFLVGRSPKNNQEWRGTPCWLFFAKPPKRGCPQKKTHTHTHTRFCFGEPFKPGIKEPGALTRKVRRF